jgi:hypothetical protein
VQLHRWSCATPPLLLLLLLLLRTRKHILFPRGLGSRGFPASAFARQ